MNADTFADLVVGTIKKALDEPKARLEALETCRDALFVRLAALEAKPHVKFCGVWKAGGTYVPGDATTHHGGLWVCKLETIGEPSKDFVGWQLAVKSRSVS